MDWQDKRIDLSVYICQQYDQKHLWFYTQRMSNNDTPTFTDEEVLTIYLFGIMQQHTQIKAIYTYTKDHLSDWFPHLPTYAGYIQRLNRLCVVFAPLIEQIQKDSPATDVCEHTYRVDSMPIVMAQSARSGKACVAEEQLANKGRCASKKMGYYGTKLHIVAQDRENGLPKAEYFGLTGAAEHDLTALRQGLPVLRDGHLYGDKIYADQPLKDTLSKQQNLIFETPVKRKKGQESLTEAEKDFSRAVSSIRQPIEALFSWIERKTNISMASRVRSYEGLLVHVFGRLTAACFLLAFYS